MPLHIAVYRENLEEIATLLKSGADPNASGEYGERPVQIAINCRNSEIIKLLLEAGASLDRNDGEGRNAWKIAEIVHFSDQLQRIVSS